MNEIEDKKFSCVCGSEVKDTNRKAHEKTKKHTNFLLTNPSGSASGFNNVMPMKNLPVPRQPRKKYVRQVQEDEDAYADGVEDDYEDDGAAQEHEEGDDEDDGFEEELMQTLDTIHQGVENLVADKSLLRKDIQSNISMGVRDINFLVNPQLNAICDRLRCIEDKLNFLAPNAGVIALSANPIEPPKWINDKCTQRN